MESTMFYTKVGVTRGNLPWLKIRYNGMKHPDNSTLQEFSNTHLNDATAEYRFFEAWFLYLSRTGEFNAVFSQASKKFTDLAKTHKTGIFSHDELAQCFAGIGNYTRVTQFAMGLLTKAVVLTDPGRQSVPFSSVANLLNLAVKVVNVRKEMYDSAKKRKKEDEGHHFQVRNWASIVAYLGILLQAMTRLDKKILHGNPILWADGYIW
ncbi:uncharacterized protein LOC110854546 isoform X2 [Folsomia candida]|uniref:uncharacterized protein LOC110854546 isoform X2 n=1 Tax=Folsomia candida TaxID=158441 RepID=UPI000B8FD81B|nr:uncharacterized protein LOC110854546 isoform X2 [Folsomia candida]XP_035711177.1 uncharacterized protein LOC110854546 isoform X2 [Folsomia candida]